MTRDEANVLIETIRKLADNAITPPTFAGGPRAGKTATAADKGPAPEAGATRTTRLDTMSTEEFERFYLKFKARLLDDLRIDPIFLHLIEVRPEIAIDIEPRIVKLDGSSLRGRIARLMAAGYFKEARAVGTVRRELARTGADPGGGGSLGVQLNDFVRDGFLVREGQGFVFAPGVKVSEKELKAI